MGIQWQRAVTLAAWWAQGVHVARCYHRLVGREFWAADQWREFQADSLRQLVRHCYENVPFYRDRFDACRVRPQDIRGPEDLLRIPVLTKEEARANIERLLARNIPRRRLKPTTTSGSTGKPLTLYTDARVSEYTEAGMWRDFVRCGWEPGEKVAGTWGQRPLGSLPRRWMHAVCDRVAGIVYLDAWCAGEREFEQWLAKLKAQRPTVLVCFPSMGSRLARWLMDRQEAVPGIKGVFTTAERLYEYERDVLTQAFGCRVFDFYGSQEVRHVACQCEKGQMHIFPDMVVVETGEPDELGHPPLILTGLVNWAMPVLRYQVGDSGSLKQGRCDCGRESPLMELQITRLSDVFRFPNGKEYPGQYFIHSFSRAGFEGVELFQFHQDQPDHIWLRVVKGRTFSPETGQRLEALVREIEEQIERQARVELAYSDGIEQTASGKHCFVRSDVTRPPASAAADPRQGKDGKP